MKKLILLAISFVIAFGSNGGIITLPYYSDTLVYPEENIFSYRHSHKCEYHKCEICGKKIYRYRENKSDGIIRLDGLGGYYVGGHEECDCEKAIEYKIDGEVKFVCKNCYEKYIERLDREKRDQENKIKEQWDKIIKESENLRIDSKIEEIKRDIEDSKRHRKSLEKQIDNYKKFGVPYDKDSLDRWREKNIINLNISDTVSMCSLMTMIRIDTVVSSFNSDTLYINKGKIKIYNDIIYTDTSVVIKQGK